MIHKLGLIYLTQPTNKFIVFCEEDTKKADSVRRRFYENKDNTSDILGTFKYKKHTYKLDVYHNIIK